MNDVGDFVFPGISSRVIFGTGTISRVGDELARLKAKTALILSGRQQADQAQALAARLGKMSVGTFAEATMHTPVDVTMRAVEAFRASAADCIVALGGGSAVGLSKAVATRTGADQVVIPTTYAGSEMTDILGETVDGQKTTRRDPSIRPETVIYDVNLTLGLPVGMTVTSALNAIAHGIEGLYATNGSPITDMMALDAMREFKSAMPQVLADPSDVAARGRVLYGAWLCSTVLGYVEMALHHKLCHVLGGSFGLPHAETHAIMLPHTAGFNAVAVPEKLAPVAEIFGGSVGGGLWDFAKSSGAPLRLADFGLAKEDLGMAADIATSSPYPNPRGFDCADVRTLLEAAWYGDRP